MLVTRGSVTLSRLNHDSNPSPLANETLFENCFSGTLPSATIFVGSVGAQGAHVSAEAGIAVVTLLNTSFPSVPTATGRFCTSPIGKKTKPDCCWPVAMLLVTATLPPWNQNPSPRKPKSWNAV